MSNVIYIIIYSILSAGGLIAIKYGSLPVQSAVSFGPKDFPITLYTLIGVALYGGSFLLYMFLISKYDLGYIVPLTTAIVYILVFSLSYKIFDEVFSVPKIIAITLILVGVIILSTQPKSTPSHSDRNPTHVSKMNRYHV